MREVFRVPRIGAVAGCYVRDGKITRGSKVRFLRDGTIIWKGAINSLRRFKDDVREVADEPGDRLLHWDLHYENVLASDREPWLAIDPKPLAGDPGFDLMPALDNRFDASETLWRFDLMTEVLGLDRERARAWTLGRVLQNSLWHVLDGERALDPDQVSIARSLLAP